MLSSKKHSQKHLSFVITKQKVNHRLAVFAKSDSPFKCELGLLTFPLFYVPTKSVGYSHKSVGEIFNKLHIFFRYTIPKRWHSS